MELEKEEKTKEKEQKMLESAEIVRERERES